MARREQPSPLTKKHLDRMHREQQQTRWILIGSAVVLVGVILVILYGVLDQNVLKYRRAVADINGEKISAQDFRSFTKYYRYNLIRNVESNYQIAQMFGGGDPQMLQQFLGQMQQAAAQLDPETAGQAALNQMVDRVFLKQLAMEKGIRVTDEEINKSMQAWLGYYPEGTPTPTQTYAPIPTSTLSPTQQSMLRPTATTAPTVSATAAVTATDGLTSTQSAAITVTAEPEITATAASPITATATTIPPTPAPTLTPTPYTEEGYQNFYSTVVADFDANQIPEATLRFLFETDLYREKLMEQVLGEAICVSPQVWAQHILVNDPSVAAIVAGKLKAGEDWYALAAEYSTDSSNADQGGDLGWFGRGAMVKEFEDAAFSLEVGQISDPVQSQFGYHIIRLLGKEDRRLTPTECQQERLSQFQVWLNDQRTTANIQLLDYWKQIYPLEPTLPADIQQLLQQAAGAGLP